MEYEGVFFVTAPEFSDVGYFTTEDHAESYIHRNWDEVKENSEDWEEEGDE